MGEEFLATKKLLDRSRRIAIVPGSDFQGEKFVASLALFSILRKLGKETTLLADNFPPHLRFLQEKNNSPQQAVLAVNVLGKKLKEVRYEKTTDRLNFYLNLDEGSLAPSDITLSVPSLFDIRSTLEFQPDIVVTLGILQRTALSEKLKSSRISPSALPVINIDNTTQNERFGFVNLIDTNAPSLSELVGDFIFAHYGEFIDEHVATILLTAILIGSQNFQHPSTGPTTFERAASLLEKGADHQLIVTHLYKTKSAAHLRLLGRALENIEVNEEKRITCTTLSRTDFERTKTSSKDLSFVFNELKTNFLRNDSLVLLWESHGSGPLVKGIFFSKKQGEVRKLLAHTEGIARGHTALFLLREPLLGRAKEKLLRVFE